MSWAEAKKINSDLEVPLNELIAESVGLRTDTANPAGSLHAKILSLFPWLYGIYKICTPSNNISFALDTQRGAWGGRNTYVKVKSARVALKGTVRLYWEYTHTSGNFYAMKTRPYINGVAAGTEISYAGGFSPTWQNASQDLSVSPGDTVEIWVSGENNGGGTNTMYVRNFRLKYDLATGNCVTDYDQ